MNKINDLLHGMEIFSYPTKFNDKRGEYFEIFNSEQLVEKEFNIKQISIVKPTKNSLRGFHGDKGTAKVISVLSGKFYIAIVDPRENSSTYGKFFEQEISGKENIALYLPAGLGNGFLALSSNCEYMYIQNTLYGEYKQFTINYLDSTYNVNWPKRQYIISKRDQKK
tara:strand:+ start:699 stop:1199 length:501 start_codon:yes stop_codon:yes gene_type:complete